MAANRQELFSWPSHTRLMCADQSAVAAASVKLRLGCMRGSTRLHGIPIIAGSRIWRCTLNVASCTATAHTGGAVRVEHYNSPVESPWRPAPVCGLGLYTESCTSHYDRLEDVHFQFSW